MCSYAIRASLSYLFSCFMCVVPYVLSCHAWFPYMFLCLTCLLPKGVLCPSYFTFFRCLIRNRLSCISCLIALVSRVSCIFYILAIFFFYPSATVNQHGIKFLLKKSCYISFFIGDISLQDPLTYDDLTVLIYQPEFVR